MTEKIKSETEDEKVEYVQIEEQKQKQKTIEELEHEMWEYAQNNTDVHLWIKDLDIGFDVKMELWGNFVQGITRYNVVQQMKREYAARVLELHGLI